MTNRVFSAGDRVLIRQWEDMEREFGVNTDGNIDCCFTFTNDMRRLCGREFTIRKVESNGRIYFQNDAIDLIRNFSISADMLEFLSIESKVSEDSLPEVSQEAFSAILG